MKEPLIKLVTHPYPMEIIQARRDDAEVTGQPLVERPWWYEHKKTGTLFHDIYGCIGWPSDIDDPHGMRAGYAAIVGVVRPSDNLENISAQDARFVLLEDTQSRNVKTLLKNCLEMRERYGFGLRSDLFEFWYGDPARFIDDLSVFNERLSRSRHDKNRKAIFIAPPDSYEAPDSFDIYSHSLRSVLHGEREEKRLFATKEAGILKNRIKEYRRNDPCAMAIGGLIHTLLNRCLWMDDLTPGAWRMEN